MNRLIRSGEVGDRRWTLKKSIDLQNGWRKYYGRFLHFATDPTIVRMRLSIRWIMPDGHLPAAATTKEGKLIGHCVHELEASSNHPSGQTEVFVLPSLPPSEDLTGRSPSTPIPPHLARFISPERYSNDRIPYRGDRQSLPRWKLCHPLQTWESALR